MKLKIWEISLFFALFVTVLWSLAAMRGQDALAEQLIRLHVVAQSDSVADQEAKLMVRDAVQQLVEPWLADASSRTDAMEVIAARLDEVNAAAAAAIDPAVSVRVDLTRGSFPTRAYDTFTLPAGSYYALMIELGDAVGSNWWCVVFPPLCIDAATAPVAIEAAGLSDSEVALITGDGTGVAMRFWTLEALEHLRVRVFG